MGFMILIVEKKRKKAEEEVSWSNGVTNNKIIVQSPNLLRKLGSDSGHSSVGYQQ